MASSSIVAQATAHARRTAALALCGAAIIVGMMVSERLLYQHDQASARDRLAEAFDAADDIRLADEQLTMSARLAAASGEARWVQRYKEAIPLIDDAMARAEALAPKAAVAEFHSETSAANRELMLLERTALAAIGEGDLEAAQAILDGDDYARHKATLSAGADELIEGVIAEIQSDLHVDDLRGGTVLVTILALCLLGAAFLWRFLTMSLARSVRPMIEAETTIRTLAKTDVLTGLSNRRALVDTLKNTVARAERNRAGVAVLMIDLDRFKPINDRFGHVVGDLVLKEVARRLDATLRSGEVSARFGGDEFVVVMETPRNCEGPHRVAKRIIEALSEPMEIDGAALRVGATVGIAAYPCDATSGDELLRTADVALYRAKEQGRGRAERYHAEMDADLDARARLEDDLRAAIAANEITPYFQPFVDLASGDVLGFEVLSRWNHPTRGLLAPAEFIGLAERTGMISDLTLALLRSACNAAHGFPDHLTLSLNIAPQQIEDAWLAERIMAVLTDVGFPAGRLEIELTEAALVTDLAAAKRVITSLKNLGVGVALDDFGTGYSSLCYLSELAFDRIKIDRSFVSGLTADSESAKVVNAIVGLGRSLGVPTLAEGVETAEAADYLLQIGCAAAQGWHFAKAVPAEIARDIVAGRGPHHHAHASGA